MNLLDSVYERMNLERGVISITGSGGKSTLMVKLAQYLSAKGKSVLLTTTTRILSPKLYKYGQDEFFRDEAALLAADRNPGCIHFYGYFHIMDPKCVRSPRREILDILPRLYDFVIIDCDLSWSLPLTIHKEEYPVVDSITDFTIAVMGMSGYGKHACECVCNSSENIIVDDAYLQNLIDDEDGPLKGIMSESVLLMNQCDILKSDELSSIKRINCKIPVFYCSILRNTVV